MNEEITKEEAFEYFTEDFIHISILRVGKSFVRQDCRAVASAMIICMLVAVALRAMGLIPIPLRLADLPIVGGMITSYMFIKLFDYIYDMRRLALFRKIEPDARKDMLRKIMVRFAKKADTYAGDTKRKLFALIIGFFILLMAYNIHLMGYSLMAALAVVLWFSAIIITYRNLERRETGKLEETLMQEMVLTSPDNLDDFLIQLKNDSAAVDLTSAEK